MEIKRSGSQLSGKGSLKTYLDPIAKHLAEEVNEISDYLRAELLNE